MAEPLDKVFKALADPTRRIVLDRLHERNGQTLGELAGELRMTRQSATQHLAVLEDANLISTIRRGREKLHYLNPVPLQQVHERWIDKFETPRLHALGELARTVEGSEVPNTPTYVYVTYIQSTAEKVWDALTDADLTAAFWGHSNVSDWKPGSRWEHRRADGSGIADVVGTVVRAERPGTLVITFDSPSDEPVGEPSVVTFEIVGQDNLDAVSAGCPAVAANLKSLLETGHVLPQAPWEMDSQLRAAQMAKNDVAAELPGPASTQ